MLGNGIRRKAVENGEGWELDFVKNTFQIKKKDATRHPQLGESHK